MSKSILIILLALIFPVFIHAQPAEIKGITLSSQEQIDHFPIDFLGQNHFEGNIFISGEDITNLDSLYPITSMSDSLYIYNCNNLISITGLSNLTNIHCFSISNSNKLKSLKGLEGIHSIETLIIQYMNSLESLEGLNNLEKIFFELLIKENSNLTDLSAIHNLYHLNHIYLAYNPRLKTLNGLQSVLFCDMGIDIGDNESLEDISFDNLVYAHHISILRNPHLKENSFPKLMELNQYLVVGRNDRLSDLGDFQLLERANYLSVWRNLAMKDIFGLNDQIKIATGVYFANNDSLTNISGLNTCLNLNELTIKENGLLQKIEGLENLLMVEENLEISDNHKLSEISAFSSLKRVGKSLLLSKNYQLSSMVGFENLQRIGHDLMIHRNNRLQNLHGLQSLVSVNNDLKIDDNRALKNLHGLENLSMINGIFSVISNDSLNSLAGIDHLRLTTPYVYIYENYKLSVCNINSICEILNEDTKAISIFNNAPGCNSKGEVLAACEESGAFAPHAFPMLEDHPKWNILELQTSLPNIAKTISYTYDSDTIFCGKKYSIAHLADLEKTIYIRSTHNKALYRSNNDCQQKEYLLYDYRLSVGDTAWLGWRSHSLNTDTIAFKLVHIDTVLQFGKNRRRFQLDYADIDPSIEGSIKWIEGIGAENHPFYPYAKLDIDHHYEYSLLCYDSLWFQLYQNPLWNTCDTNYTAIDELDQSEFNILPNPFQNQFRIKSTKDKIQEVRIYTTTGVLLHQLLIQDKTSLEVDMNKSLPNGVYILQIFTKNNRIQRKILKL